MGVLALLIDLGCLEFCFIQHSHDNTVFSFVSVAKMT